MLFSLRNKYLAKEKVFSNTTCTKWLLRKKIKRNKSSISFHNTNLAWQNKPAIMCITILYVLQYSSNDIFYYSLDPSWKTSYSLLYLRDWKRNTIWDYAEVRTDCVFNLFALKSHPTLNWICASRKAQWYNSCPWINIVIGNGLFLDH